jgi:hypothetical protein
MEFMGSADGERFRMVEPAEVGFIIGDPLPDGQPGWLNWLNWLDIEVRR